MRKLAATMSSLSGFSHPVAGISYVSRFPAAGTDSDPPALPMYLSKFARAWACPVGRTCILPQGFQHSQQCPRHPLKAVGMAAERAVEVDPRRPALISHAAHLRFCCSLSKMAKVKQTYFVSSRCNNWCPIIFEITFDKKEQI